MYNVYLITDVENKDFAALDPFMRFLPSETRETALQFRRSIDRKNCILSYFLLQYALFKNYGICAFTLSNGVNGKPYLSDYPHIHFNSSHCDYGCICAIADSPIGIDIQEIRPFSWSIANRCCSVEEKQLLRNSADPAAEFTKIWTMKESYLKMKGTGITVDLCSIDTTKLRDKIKTFEVNGCYVSVASAESFSDEEEYLI